MLYKCNSLARLGNYIRATVYRLHFASRRQVCTHPQASNVSITLVRYPSSNSSIAVSPFFSCHATRLYSSWFVQTPFQSSYNPIHNRTTNPTHSFALSLTVPIFSRSEYFFNTLSLWYFQNCLVASLPATLLRIFAPPGCSSTKPAR